MLIFSRLLLTACILCPWLPPAAGGADAPAFEEILKIDVHAHIFEEIPDLVSMLREKRAFLINVCNRGMDGHLEESHRIAADLAKKHPALFAFASDFDLTQFGKPGYQAQVTNWLDRTFEQGAVMTKIWKEVGLELKDADGKYVLPDDPAFDPIYEHLALRKKPLLAHLAEPIEAWQPLRKGSVHYGYYANNPQWHLYNKAGFPSHEQIIAARDRILERHPDLMLIGAHLGSLEHDLDGLAARLDKHPNFYFECAGRIRDLMRYPVPKVREFFIKFQDRGFYGADVTWKPFLQGPRTSEQKAAFVRNLEKRYRADYAYFSSVGEINYDGAKAEGISLPPAVLQKLFHENAERLVLRRTVARP